MYANEWQQHSVTVAAIVGNTGVPRAQDLLSPRSRWALGQVGSWTGAAKLELERRQRAVLPPWPTKPRPMCPSLQAAFCSRCSPVRTPFLHFPRSVED